MVSCLNLHSTCKGGPLMFLWPGLMYLCMDDMLAIRTLVNTLRIPSLETRVCIQVMF